MLEKNGGQKETNPFFFLSYKWFSPSFNKCQNLQKFKNFIFFCFPKESFETGDKNLEKAIFKHLCNVKNVLLLTHMALLETKNSHISFFVKF